MNTPLPPSSFPSATFPPEPLLAVACPTCFGAIAVGTDLFGQAAECPLCGQGFQVPTPAVAAPPPQQPEQAAPVGLSPTGRSASESTEPRRQRRRDVTSPPRHESPAEPVIQPAAAAPADAPQAEAAPTKELEFQEPVRTITSGGQVIALRRLTPEEKAVRRGRRNLIMMLTGVSILMAIVLLLGTKRTRRRS